MPNAASYATLRAPHNNALITFIPVLHRHYTGTIQVKFNSDIILPAITDN